MGEENKREEREWDYIKIGKDDKLEDFDFYELTGDLTNSITDQLYRSYLPPLEQSYKNIQIEFGDNNYKNDLDVKNIIKRIREDAEERIVRNVSFAISKEVTKQLEEQYHPKKGSFEDRVDRGLKSVRWLMLIPFFLIYIVIFALIIVIFSETIEAAKQAWEYSQKVFSGTDMLSARAILNGFVATVLSILDLLLLGTLIIMVLVGGYENTIARIGLSHDVPTWFGKLDIGQLKVKVAASIVIISSIHLLMSFMQLNLNEEVKNPDTLMWTAIIHGVFVLSALTLTYMEKLNTHTEHQRARERRQRVANEDPEK